MKPHRRAVLDAGLIGRKHLQTIAAMPDVTQLVAVVDPHLSPADARTFTALLFDDLVHMLDAVQPEAVIVATSNAMHAQQALVCCQRGIHVLLEKPVTVSLEEAQQVVAAIHQTGVKTLAGHHRRYLAAVRQGRDQIVQGALGQLVVASVVWANRKPDDDYKVPWRTQAGGRPLLINVIHKVDMLRFLCGEIHSVTGVKSQAVRGIEVEDTAAAILEFDNHFIATLTCADAGLSP